jgi:hypothetical protein
MFSAFSRACLSFHQLFLSLPSSLLHFYIEKKEERKRSWKSEHAKIRDKLKKI